MEHNVLGIAFVHEAWDRSRTRRGNAAIMIWRSRRGRGALDQDAEAAIARMIEKDDEEVCEEYAAEAAWALAPARVWRVGARNGYVIESERG